MHVSYACMRIEEVQDAGLMDFHTPWLRQLPPWIAVSRRRHRSHPFVANADLHQGLTSGGRGFWRRPVRRTSTVVVSQGGWGEARSLPSGAPVTRCTATTRIWVGGGCTATTTHHISYWKRGNAVQFLQICSDVNNIEVHRFEAPGPLLLFDCPRRLPRSIAF